jgi:competence protein ComFB
LIELKNYMETLVDDLIESVLRNYDDSCQDEICQLDVKAIALNNLKPMYYVRREGEAYNRAKMLEAQFKLSIIQEIVRAIEIVRKNPRRY